MERFIGDGTKNIDCEACKFKIQYGEIYSVEWHKQQENTIHLKSSMERFIEKHCTQNTLQELHLKSSMERFIVTLLTSPICTVSI